MYKVNAQELRQSMQNVKTRCYQDKMRELSFEGDNSPISYCLAAAKP